MFGSWEPGVSATLVGNPLYYYRGVTHTAYDGGAHTITGGLHDLDETFNGEPGGGVVSHWIEGPFVEEIQFVHYGSEDAAFGAFIRGDVDFVAADFPSEYRQRILALTDVEVAVNPSEAFRYLAFNVRHAPMNDVAFRQAIAYLTDKEAILAAQPEGTGEAIYTLIPPQNPFWYTDDVNHWGQGMSEAERFDAAVGVLTDAEYTWTTRPEVIRDGNGLETGEYLVGEGLTQPDGTPIPELTLLVPTGAPVRLDFGEWISEWAARLGITITSQPTDHDAIFATVFAEDPWDMYMSGWSGGNPSMPCGWHQWLLGATKDFNTPGYSNPDFEALSDAHDRATTLDEVRLICADMERHLADNLPYMLLFRPYITEAWRNTVDFPITSILGGISSLGWGWLGSAEIHD
jgi:ABC-type transport system substrate-binding protein